MKTAHAAMKNELLVPLYGVYSYYYVFPFLVVPKTYNTYKQHYFSENKMCITVEPHLFGLIGKASHPDKQKIWIIGFFFDK
jgi:predicted NAD-dependent protein-ADP-ribosyltransferase YbiA (DUF1768 family)